MATTAIFTPAPDRTIASHVGTLSASKACRPGGDSISSGLVRSQVGFYVLLPRRSPGGDLRVVRDDDRIGKVEVQRIPLRSLAAIEAAVRWW